MISRRSFLQGAIAVAMASIVPGSSRPIEELIIGTDHGGSHPLRIGSCKFPEIVKSMETRLKELIFEPNNQFTRDKWSENVNKDISHLVYERKILDLKIICDETNNNPEMVNNGIFSGSVLVQPTPRVEYLQYGISTKGS